MSLYYELQGKKQFQNKEKLIGFKNFKVNNQYLVVKQLKSKRIYNQQGIQYFSPNKQKHLPHLRLPSLPTSESRSNFLLHSPKHEQASFQDNSVQLSKLRKSFEFKGPQSDFYIMHRIIEPPQPKKQSKLTYISDDQSFEYKISKIKQKYSFHQFDDSNISPMSPQK